MARPRWAWGKEGGLALLGLASLLPYLYALQQPNLRQDRAALALAVGAALACYLPAAFLVIRDPAPTPRGRLLLIVGFALAFRGLLIFTQPVISDDMYRYVWDGRVQAAGINPYAFPPEAAEVSALRDGEIWPLINRKWAVTIYPGGAQLTFAALWRIWPDSVRWFQAVMAGGTVVAGILLMALLKALGRPAGRALIFLWSPAVIFETAHSAHVDGVMLICLVAAWLAHVRGRAAWTGASLGLAAALKLWPAMFAPALWSWRGGGRGVHGHGVHDGRPRPWVMPGAAAAVFLATYLPYLRIGQGVIGYLPIYFTERGSASPQALLGQLVPALRIPDGPAGNLPLALVLAAFSLYFVWRPARDGETALRRCVWPLVAFAVLTQYLLPWYLLPIVLLCAIFVQGGRWGLRFDGWTLLMVVISGSTLGYAFLPV